MAVSASDLVRLSFMDAKSQADRARQRRAQNRQNVYEDDYTELLKQRISATFAQANAEELCKVLDTTNNPLKRIVNEISTLYTKPPVWKFADTKTGETWRQILKKARGPVVFPKLNRMVNLQNTALLYARPGIDSLVFKIVLPQHAEVWPDSNRPEMPFAVRFCEHNAAVPSAEPVYHMWDRREGSAGYRKYDAKGNEIASARLANPYFDERGQIIPLVAYHRAEPTSDFWDDTTGDDLYELTIMLGMWETWINHLQRTDSTRQKYATGLLDSAGNQEGGPLGILSLRSPDGTPVTVGEFSSQSDWNGLGGQIRRKYENVTNGYGLLSPESKSSGDPTSGFALRVRKEGLADLREQQIPIYEASDLALYSMVAAVWNFELTNSNFPLLVGDPLPEASKAKPEIVYAAFQTSQTVEEQAAVFALDKERMSLGLESPITIYLKDHPGLTEEEARAAIEKNTLAMAVEGAEEVDPATALNGAQVASLLEVVKAVAEKQLPRESGVEIILAAFPVDRMTADRMLGPVGTTFFAEPKVPPSFAAPKAPAPADEETPAEE